MDKYLLKTYDVIKPMITKNGIAHMVDKNNFSELDSISCFLLEIYDESMRLPHWHPNAMELGYLISGELEIFLWRYTGEASRFNVKAGSCWFIPQGALHSLNNVSKGKIKMLVGFSSDMPQNIDLHTAFNGIPIVIRNNYTDPHSELKNWKGSIHEKLLGDLPSEYISDRDNDSPYVINLNRVSPLFRNNKYGEVVWAIKDNWHILNQISILRCILRENMARDPIWYPDVSTLYVVVKGHGKFTLVMTDLEPTPFEVKDGDYIFVPKGILHTFLNLGSSDFEIIAFFSKDDPLPEVSLLVATSFFPNAMIGKSLFMESSITMKKKLRTPYIVKVLHDNKKKYKFAV